MAHNNNILGYVAMYANDIGTKTAYVTLIGVRTEYQNMHVGRSLLQQCSIIASICGMKKLRLEVSNKNWSAIRFYQRNGFVGESIASDKSTYMVKDL